jgi:hypothetical protein
MAMARAASFVALKLAPAVKPLKSVRPGVGMVIIAVGVGVIRIVIIGIGREIRVVAGGIVLVGISGGPGCISRTPGQGQRRAQKQGQKDQPAHLFTAL